MLIIIMMSIHPKTLIYLSDRLPGITKYNGIYRAKEVPVNNLSDCEPTTYVCKCAYTVQMHHKYISNNHKIIIIILSIGKHGFIFYLHVELVSK